VKLSLNFLLKFLSGYALARPLSTSVRGDTAPVDLDYTAYIPPNGNKTEGALLLIHGLLYVRVSFLLVYFVLSSGSGSKRVWTSLSKRFLEELGIPIYALVSKLSVFYWLQS
jgi:hypothetical protein